MVFLLECSFSYFAPVMSLSTCLNSMLYFTADRKEMHTHQTAVASKHISEQHLVSNRKHRYTSTRLTVDTWGSIYMLPVTKELKGRSLTNWVLLHVLKLFIISIKITIEKQTYKGIQMERKHFQNCYMWILFSIW